MSDIKSERYSQGVEKAMFGLFKTLYTEMNLWMFFITIFMFPNKQYILCQRLINP